MIYQNSAWRNETGLTLDPLGQPLEPIAKGEKMETTKTWEEKIRSGEMRAEKGLDTSSNSVYSRLRKLGLSDFDAQKSVFAEFRPIEKITKAQMKAKVLAWIEWLKSEDRKLCKEHNIPESYLSSDYSSFRVDDVEVEGGAKGFELHFDASHL